MTTKIPKRDAPPVRANAAITLQNVADAFASNNRFLPLLSLEQAAKSAALAPFTIKDQLTIVKQMVERANTKAKPIMMVVNPIVNALIPSAHIGQASFNLVAL